MKFRIPKDWVIEFSQNLLREADVEEEKIVDIEQLIYEACQRNWDEFETYDGDEMYSIDFDDWFIFSPLSDHAC